MLLYDRVRGITEAKARSGDAMAIESAHTLSIATVFDLTGALDQIRMVSVEAGVPHRPPFPVTWCEWDETYTHEEIATLHADAAKTLSSLTSRNAELTVMAGMSVLDELCGREESSAKGPDADEFVITFKFMMPMKADGKPFPRTMIAAVSPAIIACMSQGSARIDRLLEFNTKDGIFGLPVMDQDDDNAAKILSFSAFALLNCRNVGREVVHPPQIKSSRRPEDYIPRAKYHVLKIEVPLAAAMRRDPAAPTGRKMPFHVVRGHFKNLRHERFAAKGWHWWAPHWRGDAEVGTVMKDYAVVEKKG